MASARFLEILRCNGVDQDATPHPAMVVPFGGENQVVLETSGLDLRFQHSALNLQEFDGYELTTDLLRGVRDELSISRSFTCTALAVALMAVPICRPRPASWKIGMPQLMCERPPK